MEIFGLAFTVITIIILQIYRMFHMVTKKLHFIQICIIMYKDNVLGEPTA